jgi:hypothetical protein
MRFYDLTVCLVCLKVGCTSLPKKNAKLKTWKKPLDVASTPLDVASTRF